MRRINGNTAKALIIAIITGIQGIVANSFGTTATVDSSNLMGGRAELFGGSVVSSSENPAPTLFGFGEKSLTDKLKGSWLSTTGPKQKLTFEKSGGVSILVYADLEWPIDITVRGVYKVTGSKSFTIQEGGEFSDGVLEDGILTITKRGNPFSGTFKAIKD